jgi:hypothetical protein|tara:strand:- start:2495 stop:3280 length:786 start_codon:yes stop_codon:yes gene_type:complete
MAMEVNYEEYSSTSSSKHHGWKVEISRRHQERQEMEALEEEIANKYARIDCGLSVGDLTCPRSVKLIKEMDRLRIGPSSEPRYVTYPELQGLCDSDTVPSTVQMLENASDKSAEDSNTNQSRRHLEKVKDSQKTTARRLVTEKLIASMPLVRVGGAGKLDGQNTLHEAPLTGSTTLADGTAVVLASDMSRSMTELSKQTSSLTLGSNTSALQTRPERLVQYDMTIGVDPKKAPTDAELDAEKIDDTGQVSDVAYRDLEQLD